ncbi:uncharacterized protein LOC119095069 [Pollicipes pollicipes]|uniref:uncharacterized protein LOC119095069 n=1 Tax=Pollicipes pollicipes TaxID=41117 RepID=UPI00188532A7|nr:uncharacterized protein LOC119095069 [Pollicipes pollicipes]
MHHESRGPRASPTRSATPWKNADGKPATATQYHAQDGLGRYRYSYKHPGSAREEYVDENGRIQGSYSYRDPNDEKLSMKYYADDTGFHVKRAVLPDLAARAPRDEPAVAAIKAAHIRLWRSMWERAAAASIGAPIDPNEPPREEYVPLPEEIAPLDAESQSRWKTRCRRPLSPTSRRKYDSAQYEPAQYEPSANEPDEPIVPIYPGAPDAPAQPVSSAPKPLPRRPAVRGRRIGLHNARRTPTGASGASA